MQGLLIFTFVTLRKIGHCYFQIQENSLEIFSGYLKALF